MRAIRRLGFQFQTTVITIFAIPWLSVVMVVVLMVCFIMPLLYLSWIENNEQLNNSYLQQLNFDYRISIEGSTEQLDFIDENAILAMPSIEKCRIAGLLIRVPGSVKKSPILVNAIGMNEAAFAAEYGLCQGRLPTAKEIDSGASVCVVSLDFFNKYHLALGDRIQFWGNALRVVGVSVKSYAVPTFLVSTSYLEKLRLGRGLIYRLDVTAPNATKAELHTEFAAQLPQSNLKIEDVDALRQSALNRAESAHRYLLKRTFAMLGLSLFSISLIMSGYFLNKRRAYGVKLSFAAAPRYLLSEMIFEIMLYALFSVSLDLIIISQFDHLFVWLMPVYININWLVNSLGLAVLSSVFLALLLWSIIVKTRPIQLISR